MDVRLPCHCDRSLQGREAAGYGSPCRGCLPALNPCYRSLRRRGRPQLFVHALFTATCCLEIDLTSRGCRLWAPHCGGCLPAFVPIDFADLSCSRSGFRHCLPGKRVLFLQQDLACLLDFCAAWRRAAGCTKPTIPCGVLYPLQLLWPAPTS